MTDTTNADPTPSVDPEAPYGRHPDGSPKKSNGGRPAGSGTRKSTGKRRRLTPPRPSTPRKAAGKAEDFRPGLNGIVGAVTLALTRVSPLDAAALAMRSDGLVEAVNQVAQEQAQIRALCLRLQSVGPYGPLITEIAGLGAQVAENHGWIPTEVAVRMGATPRDQLVAQLGLHADAKMAAHQAEQPEPDVPEQTEPAPEPAHDANGTGHYAGAAMTGF